MFMKFTKKWLGIIKTFVIKVWKMFINFFTNRNKRKTLMVYIIVPIVLELIIESFGSERLLGGFNYFANHPIPFFCNCLIILTTLCISLFFRKRKFFLYVISFSWLILAFCNYVLLTKRVTPFTATDILLWQPALKVVTKYYSGFVIGMAIAVIILILVAIVFLGIKAPKLPYKVNYIRNLFISLLVLASTIGSINIAINTGYLKVHFDNIANAFLEYGFPYCFTNSVLNTGIKKPQDYSSDNMNILLDEIANGEEIIGDIDGVTPNVIFVQLESFFDVNRINNLILSENPIPIFTKLKEQYASGMFSVPTVGAGTANTEFEVLTGMNVEDFGPGEYPYKTVLQNLTCESIAYNLTEAGYSTHAIHNNDGTFYQRHTVYSKLGFNTFTPIEYMNVNGRYTYKGWSKDEVLTEEILKCLDSTEEKDFVFTVSVEGHGSYPTKQVLENPLIKVLDYQGEADIDSVEYYINLLKSMDDFIGQLTNTLNQIDENTIVVFYGDHLPSLNIENSQLTYGDTLQTEYIIWNNFEYITEDEDLEAFQISSKICKIIGIDNGLINKYHQQNKGLETYLTGLQNLEYDVLEGQMYIYGGTNPYIATNIKYGIYDIAITDVFVTGAEGLDAQDGSLEITIKGNNFNEFSSVFVNGTKVTKDNTTYLDTSTIQISYDTLKIGDAITIGQAGSDNVVLSYTAEYIYQ